MTSERLKAILVECQISQTDLARLLSVTARAVNLWIANERSIPGPAEAYLRLFDLLPPNLRQIELNRLKKGGIGMRDGFFGITFQTSTDSGMGVLIFENGRVCGTDVGGVRYDGNYIFEENTGLANVTLKVTFPPNVVSVFGISNPYEWSIDVTTCFNPKYNSGALPVKTSLGKSLKAQYNFLRDLPDAA